MPHPPTRRRGRPSAWRRGRPLRLTLELPPDLALLLDEAAREISAEIGVALSRADVARRWLRAEAEATMATRALLGHKGGPDGP